MDELTLTLPRKIREETRAAVEGAGGRWVPHPADAVIDRMIDEFERPGRSGGAGFYSYVDGKRAGLWPGLRTEFGADRHDVELAELSERMLVIEALETVRCFDEGVLTSVPDANIGSIFGIGFRPGPAAWSSTSRASRAAWPASCAGPTSSPPGTAPGSRSPPASAPALPPERRAESQHGSQPDRAGTLDRWPTGFSGSSTGWGRGASGC